MKLAACCFLQSQREDAAPIFSQDLAPVKEERATEQPCSCAVLATGKPQAWLMALWNRTFPGVPGKTRKCKASEQRTQKQLPNQFI